MTEPQRHYLDKYLPPPDIQCWDYSFDRSAHDTVYIASIPADKVGAVATICTHPSWHYLIVADTPEELLLSVEKNMHRLPGNLSMSDVKPQATQLHGLLNWWRMIHYKGSNLCVMSTNDLTPTSSWAWPGGPVAPVRNAFVFAARDRRTRKLLSVELVDTPLPVCAASIADMMAHAETSGVETLDLLSNYDIVAFNILDLVLEHPLIFWNNNPFPLIHCINFNPNHNGDPEEELLADIES